MRNFICIGLCLVVVILAGCATVDYSFANPDAKVTAARKVAVFPFATVISNADILPIDKSQETAVLASYVLMKELRRYTKYEMISPEEVIDRLSSNKTNLEWVYKGFLGDVYERRVLTPERLSELGSKLNADAVLVGEVINLSRYHDEVLWTAVGLTVKMVDIKSGKVLWEARDTVSDVSTIRHSFSAPEANVVSYPIVTGGVDKEPKYNTGQGCIYWPIEEVSNPINNSISKLCRDIVSTLPKH